MSTTIDYTTLIADAYLVVVREALGVIAKDPEMGKYCVEISINTQHDDVVLPKWLKEQYPNILTIILNNRFEQLRTKNYDFSVVLYFKNKPVELVIPYDSIVLFNDTMNNFQVSFSDHLPDNETPEEIEEPVVEKVEAHSAEIISLDSFRNKKP